MRAIMHRDLAETWELTETIKTQEINKEKTA